MDMVGYKQRLHISILKRSTSKRKCSQPYVSDAVSVVAMAKGGTHDRPDQGFGVIWQC